MGVNKKGLGKIKRPKRIITRAYKICRSITFEHFKPNLSARYIIIMSVASYFCTYKKRKPRMLS